MVCRMMKTKCLNDSLSLIWQICRPDVERPQQLRRNARDDLPLAYKIASQPLEECYAARVTESAVSFLPRRRRIVRGLIWRS
jgi:hypothetical protein